MQLSANRWDVAGFMTVFATVDKSTITVNKPSSEQTGKTQTCQSHVSGSHWPSFSGRGLTDVFRGAEATRLGKGSVDL